MRARVGCAGLRGLPHTREVVARAQVAGFDAAPHHEAGPSVQMMRVRFCLEAAEKPSYPAAYGILAMRVSTFLLLLSYVVWPRHMMVRRATSARGGVLFRLYAGGAARRARARPFACWGGCPLAPSGAVEPSPAGERDEHAAPVRTLVLLAS